MLTDNEIKKALECCKSSSTILACHKCPARRNKDCNGSDINVSRVLLDDALDLINRQQAEIEELRKGLDIWTDIAHRETQYVEQAKSEAYKEFAERAKEVIVYNTIRRYSDANGISYVLEDMVNEDIDNLVKELTEVSGNENSL